MNNNGPLVKIGDVSDVSAGNSAPQDSESFLNGTVPFVRMSDLSSDTTSVILSTRDYLSGSGVAKHGIKIHPRSAILFPKSGASIFLNRRAMLGTDAAVSSHLAVIKAKRTVDPWYLFYALQNVDAGDLVPKNGYPSLPLGAIENILIPLPPLPEQRRIAEILGSVDDVTSIYTSEKARHNLLLAEVRDRIFESLNGSPTPLSESLLETKYGTSKPNNDRGLGYPVLRIPNIVEGTIRIDDLKFVDLSASEYESLRLHPGDLLIVRTNGNPDYVGRCVVTGHDEDGMAFASYLIRLKVKDNVNPVFVRHYLLSSLGRQHLAGNIRTSAGNYNLNSESIKELPIVTPSKAEQDAYVLRLSALEALIEKDELVIRKLLHLKTALMQRLLASQHQVAI